MEFNMIHPDNSADGEFIHLPAYGTHFRDTKVTPESHNPSTLKVGDWIVLKIATEKKQAGPFRVREIKKNEIIKTVLVKFEDLNGNQYGYMSSRQGSYFDNLSDLGINEDDLKNIKIYSINNRMFSEDLEASKEKDPDFKVIDKDLINRVSEMARGHL